MTITFQQALGHPEMMRSWAEQPIVECPRCHRELDVEVPVVCGYCVRAASDAIFARLKELHTGHDPAVGFAYCPICRTHPEHRDLVLSWDK